MVTIHILIGIFLLICTLTDLRRQVVYPAVLWPALAFAALGWLCLRPVSGGSALGGMLLGLFMLLLTFCTRGSVGAGDGLVLVVTGCLLGLAGNVRLLCGALFFATLWCLPALLLRRCRRHTQIPFIPFLLASYLCL